MEAITSVTEHHDIYRQLDEYNWDKDKEFQGGLDAILGPNPSPSQTQELTLRAQCFYLSRKKGINIDFDAYKAYLSTKALSESADTTTESHPQSTSSSSNLTTSGNTSADTYTSTSIPAPSSSDPSTSASTDNQPPPVPPHNQPHPTHGPTSTSSTMANSSNNQTPNPATAPYPATFAEIVAMIQSGEPIPGIVEIPQIVLTGKGSKPGPDLKLRRKPWEMHKSEEEIQSVLTSGEGVFGDRRDVYIQQELPDEESESAKAEQKD